MARIGALGGKATGSKGFASQVRGADGLTGRERAAIAGAKGGMLSRRKKKNCLNTDCDKGAWKHGYCHDHFIEVYREEHHE